MLRILFCGGGSVGHIAPSLAVWEALHQKEPKSRALFVCSYLRHDRAFLKYNNVRCTSVAAPKVALRFGIVLFPILFPIALLQSLIILMTFRPHVIFAKGGYVCVPLCLMAKLLRVPIVLHESDSSLGRANRMLLPLATTLCIGAPQKTLEEEEERILHTKHIATGNPVRAAFLHASADAGRRITGFSGKRPVVLIWGGSQGARILNEAVTSNLDALLDCCDIIHLTGCKKQQVKTTHARYWVREFADEEMPDLLALADIVISRAGAGSIAELAVLSKTTMLIPLPELAHNHQVRNAQYLESMQAAVILEQHMLASALIPALQKLLAAPDALQTMGKRLNTFCNPHAAEAIANIVADVARGR